MKQFIKENILESVSHFEKKLRQGKDIALCLSALKDEIEMAFKFGGNDSSQAFELADYIKTADFKWAVNRKQAKYLANKLIENKNINQPFATQLKVSDLTYDDNL